MTSKYQSLRGMRDLTPKESQRMEYIADLLKSIVIQYGYQPLHFPILESAELFRKSIGIETDIIGQEMYTFEDKNDSVIALRPEGTAGCLRSVLANGLIQRQKQKFFYCGPMFRRERPQKGRFRQFSHFGVEIFGYPTGAIDVELILMSSKMWQALNLENINLHINYLGSPKSRAQYHKILQNYWLEHKDQLSEDEKVRASENPLRLLDNKNPKLTDLIDNAPAIIDHLTEDELAQYTQIKEMLNKHNIPFIESHRLVRGLDYYSDFIFEWISDDLGSQSTILGGGRYDPLVKSMGYDIPAIGFAAGIDRIEAILTQDIPRHPAVTVAFEDISLYQEYNVKLEALRHPNTILIIDGQVGKLKNKINHAQHQSDHLLYISKESLKLISLDGKPSQIVTFDAFKDWYQQL
jgi:histidyl-tRNA synthetase